MCCYIKFIHQGNLGALPQEVHLSFVQIKVGGNMPVVQFKLADIQGRNQGKF